MKKRPYHTKKTILRVSSKQGNFWKICRGWKGQKQIQEIWSCPGIWYLRYNLCLKGGLKGSYIWDIRLSAVSKMTIAANFAKTSSFPRTRFSQLMKWKKASGWLICLQDDIFQAQYDESPCWTTKVNDLGGVRNRWGGNREWVENRHARRLTDNQ